MCATLAQAMVLVEVEGEAHIERTRSNARRRRAKATSNKLWEAAKTAEKTRDAEKNVTDNTMAIRLAHIEMIVHEMHWYAIGQCRAWQGVEGHQEEGRSEVAELSKNEVYNVAKSEVSYEGFRDMGKSEVSGKGKSEVSDNGMSEVSYEGITGKGNSVTLGARLGRPMSRRSATLVAGMQWSP